jgi:hypothetical protein
MRTLVLVPRMSSNRSPPIADVRALVDATAPTGTGATATRLVAAAAVVVVASSSMSSSSSALVAMLLLPGRLPRVGGRRPACTYDEITVCIQIHVQAHTTQHQTHLAVSPCRCARAAVPSQGASLWWWVIIANHTICTHTSTHTHMQQRARPSSAHARLRSLVVAVRAMPRSARRVSAHADTDTYANNALSHTTTLPRTGLTSSSSKSSSSSSSSCALACAPSAVRDAGGRGALSLVVLCVRLCAQCDTSQSTQYTRARVLTRCFRHACARRRRPASSLPDSENGNTQSRRMHERHVRDHSRMRDPVRATRSCRWPRAPWAHLRVTYIVTHETRRELAKPAADATPSDAPARVCARSRDHDRYSARTRHTCTTHITHPTQPHRACCCATCSASTRSRST